MGGIVFVVVMGRWWWSGWYRESEEGVGVGGDAVDDALRRGGDGLRAAAHERVTRGGSRPQHETLRDALCLSIYISFCRAARSSMGEKVWGREGGGN